VPTVVVDVVVDVVVVDVVDVVVVVVIAVSAHVLNAPSRGFSLSQRKPTMFSCL
jgi:hypothetical protein